MNNDPAWGKREGTFTMFKNQFSRISDFSIRNELIVRLMTHVDEKSIKTRFSEAAATTHLSLARASTPVHPSRPTAMFSKAS